MLISMLFHLKMFILFISQRRKVSEQIANTVYDSNWNNNSSESDPILILV